MNKANLKQLDRASTHGRDALMLTIAIIHRAANPRTQRELNNIIDKHDAWCEFANLPGKMVNGQFVPGALLHRSEA